MSTGSLAPFRTCLPKGASRPEARHPGQLCSHADLAGPGYGSAAAPGTAGLVAWRRCSPVSPRSQTRTPQPMHAPRGGSAGRRRADGANSAGRSTWLSLGTAPPPLPAPPPGGKNKDAEAVFSAAVLSSRQGAVLLLLIQRLRSSLSVRQVGTCPHEAQLDLPA